MLSKEQKAEIERGVARVLSRGTRSDPALVDVASGSDPEARHVKIVTGSPLHRKALVPLFGEEREDSCGQAPEPLVRMITRAVEVLGTNGKALRWINTPMRSLGYRAPVSLLGTSEGIARIEDALGRIEHGVW